MKRNAVHIARSEYLLYGLLILLLLGQRLFHLGPLIDDPHSWRQCDTAQYILDFHQEGIDLLYPSVNWMGNYKTVILEFPLPEAIAAGLYNIFGPHLILARLLFLLFFLGSAFYLFRLLRQLFDRRLAWDALIIYLSLPLGLYYSRALTVDFSALFFALGAVYHLIHGYKSKQPIHILLSAILFTFSFLIKAPHAFYFVFPLLYYFLKKYRFKSILPYIPLFILPLISFWLWRNHTEATNLAMPDWDFIPGYLKIADMGSWYFGDWEMRLDNYRWGILQKRLAPELTGYVGLVLALAGLFLPRTPGGKPTWFLLFWFGGLITYLMIFFSLNVIHNYYQIPFLPLLAAYIGLAIGWIRTLIPFRKIAIWVAMAHLVIVSVENVWQVETGKFYKVNTLYVEAGALIQEHFPEDKLLVVSDPFQDPRSPYFLYRARRHGWAVNLGSLNPAVLEKLKQLGARQLAILHPEPIPAPLDSVLQALPHARFPIESRKGWELEVYELK